MYSSSVAAQVALLADMALEGYASDMMDLYVVKSIKTAPQSPVSVISLPGFGNQATSALHIPPHVHHEDINTVFVRIKSSDHVAHSGVEATMVYLRSAAVQPMESYMYIDVRWCIQLTMHVYKLYTTNCACIQIVYD
jgi:hypothetical protein